MGVRFDRFLALERENLFSPGSRVGVAAGREALAGLLPRLGGRSVLVLGSVSREVFRRRASPVSAHRELAAAKVEVYYAAAGSPRGGL
jgi:hypothetical protein